MTQEEMKVLQGMFEALRKHTAQMMEEKIEPIKTQLNEMQEDISHIREQVDIAYTWVDGIDLRLKAVEKG